MEGRPISRNSTPVRGSDATALAALPSGHQVEHYVTGGEGHAGTFFVGHTFPSTPKKRTAFRWYVYYSPNFQFKYDVEECQNSKCAQFGEKTPIMDYPGDGDIYWYNYTSWNPSDVDGKMSEYKIGYSNLKGKWHRFEVVIINRVASDGQAQILTYYKNVTDNTSEILLFNDTSHGYAPDINQIVANLYRQGTCSGWEGVAYIMAAAWDTDAGQRIGAAAEIEGGTSDTEDPTLSITTTDDQTVSSSSFSVAGSASDNVGVAAVRCKIGSAPSSASDGTAMSTSTSWSGTMTLSEGEQTIYCNAWDAAGNNSTADTITATYTPPPATVEIGAVTGAMVINQ